jgi:hypothetical protein
MTLLSFPETETGFVTGPVIYCLRHNMREYEDEDDSHSLNRLFTNLAL